jgi:hypothetical protein
VLLLLAAVVGLWPAAARADNIEQEPIRYSATKASNAVSRLEERLQAGKSQLAFDKDFGYLPALLRELDILPSSQMLVFSKTSFQRSRIGPKTPRALYFNDEVYVGYCQGGQVLEISVADPKLGTAFYTLEQDGASPRFTRQVDSCLLCHCSSHTHQVPGHVVRSVLVDGAGLPILSAGTYRIDQTSPLEKRWGGWYVTGTHGPQTHLGNLVIPTKTVKYPVENAQGLNVADLSKRLDLSAYLTPHSDIVALLVLEHQAEAHNLLTQAAFQTRAALHVQAALNRELKEPEDKLRESTKSRIRSVGDQLVRYLLFCREVPLMAKVAGTSKFAAEFTARGPRDGKCRSLRDFDLETRLFKYPCSYLIFSDDFAALPALVKEYVYEQLWEILHGWETTNDFNHLSVADRQAILEILLATKADLPESWRAKGR